MSILNKLVLAASLTVLLSGCDGIENPIKKEVTSNGAHVQKLFVYDGCSVYKFYDNGAYYFTKCEAATVSSTIQDVGTDDNPDIKNIDTTYK